MSLYRDSTAHSHRHATKIVEDPLHRGGELVVYKEEQSPHHHHHEPQLHRHRSRYRTDPRLVRSRSLHRRDPSSDSDDGRRSRRKSLVVRRPRSASRVRIAEPALIVRTSSSSSDEGRRRRRRQKDQGDDVRIRATSRAGKRNQYAFVRTPSKRRRKSEGKTVVHDVEYKTDPQHRHFKHKRDDLEIREAAVLVRSRSREREGLPDHDSDSDDYRHRRGHQSSYAGSEYGRRSTRESTQYKYGSGFVDADYDRDRRPERGGPRPRRLSLSPDRGSVVSSRADGSVRRAASTVSKPKSSRAYEGSVAGSEIRSPNKYSEPAYLAESDRRAKERERDAIEREQRAVEREQRAIRREEATLGREKQQVGREMELPLRSNEDDRRRGGTDYLRDAQKYYKTGQGVLGGAKKLFS